MDKSPTYLQTIWIISCSLIQICANPDAKRLYDDIIMKGYDRNVRPATNHSYSTIISFGLRLAQIVDVDEVNQIMTVNIWALQQWTDPRFIWDRREYNNISSIFVPAEELWRPDIVLYNNADGEYAITGSGKAIIEPNGRVTYNPPMQFKSSCEIDVKYFPFDEQECHLKFGPWTHDASKVDVKHLARNDWDPEDRQIILEGGLKLTGYTKSVEWDVIETVAKENVIKYPCCVEEYPDVTFNITIRRKHLYYVINLIVPCMSMNVLTIIVFYLPSYSGEKIGVTLSVFLSLSIFQLVLFDLTPSSSVTLPLIGNYIMITSFLVTLSAMANVWILNLNHRMSSTHDMSRFVRWLFFDVLSRLLYIRKDKTLSPLDENMLSYGTGYIDLSNRSNYPSFDIEGLNTSNVPKFCIACAGQRSKYSTNIRKGLDGARFIAKHYQDNDEGNRILDEWRYVALIFDRVLLWAYSIITVVITMEIYLNAPALYSKKKPLDL